MPSALGKLSLAVAGIALVLGGVFVANVGLLGIGTCGVYSLGAEQVPEDDIGAGDDPVEFTDLTETRRDLAERTIDGGNPNVDSEEWPWAESAVVVQYQGEYYRFYTVTPECMVPPEALLGGGVLGVVAGLGALVVAGRWVFRSDESSPEGS